MDGVRGFMGEGEGGRQGPGRTVTSRVREGGVSISDGGAERVPHPGLKTQVDEPVPWFLKPGTQTRDHEGREACGLCCDHMTSRINVLNAERGCLTSAARLASGRGCGFTQRR